MLKWIVPLFDFFLNILDVLTVTFDQFNASLLNKSVNLFFLKVLLPPNFWTVEYIKLICNQLSFAS